MTVLPAVADRELTGEAEAILTCHCQGGLYVKELVSSDGGPTGPSLTVLLEFGAEVTGLDVIGVEGEDEPFEREAFFRDEPRQSV